MDIKSLMVLSFVCAMGAISPGPSLVVVLRNTISGGRLQGVMTGIGHGIGLSIYAFIAVMGLSSIILSNENYFQTIQFTGALVLIWLAYNMIIHKPSKSSEDYEGSGGRGFIEGFMIAFFNPKILIFFVAIFSQFIETRTNITDRLIIAIMAGIIDATWYVFVALILAGTSLIEKIRMNGVVIDRLIGLILLVIAILLIVKTIG